MSSIGDFGFESTAEQVTEGIDLTGRTFVVTGCNSGLGLESLRVLSLRGAHVIGTARTKDKAEAAFASLGVEGTALECELSEPASVRACAAALREHPAPLDGIVCNAGIMAVPEAFTKHGLDLQLLTNHMGHFMLVTRSAERLADDGRVVVVSSGAHHMAPEAGIELDNLSGERDYAPFKQYGQSKLANILFAKQLARRWEGTGRTANALHPGVIRTNLGRHDRETVEGFIEATRAKTIPQGAATQCLVATRPELASTSGEYFADCQLKRPSKLAMDEALAARLWERSEAIAHELLGD